MLLVTCVEVEYLVICDRGDLTILEDLITRTLVVQCIVIPESNTMLAVDDREVIVTAQLTSK